MRLTLVASIVSVLVGTALLWLTGCETTGGHRTTEGHDGHAMACKMCYDVSKSVRHEFAKGSQWSSNQVIKKHMCEDCRTEVTTYMQNGKPMIKCEKCAPAGVACDKCLPPKS